MGPTEVHMALLHCSLGSKLQHAEFSLDTTDSPPDSPGRNSSSSTEGSSTSPFSGPSGSALFNETLRFATFRGWPHDFLPPKDMAKAGFFYRGQGDQAQCIFCLIVISHWEPTDEPWSEHRRHAPNCPFLKGLPVGNIPCTETVLQSPQMTPTGLPVPHFANSGLDVCSRFVHEFRPNARPEQESRSLPGLGDDEPLSIRSSDVASIRGVQAHQRAKRPELATLEARLKTFRDWPLGLAQRPARLAEAGFYYMRTGDHVRCFCCDGALRNWEPNDEPWVEHARWFSRCTFLLSTKGADYVREIHDKYKEKEADGHSETPKREKEAPAQSVEVPAVSETPEVSAKGSQELKDALLCKICYDQPMSMVFLPCGHSMSCPSCAAALSSCPLCRKPIEATVKAFFSFT